MHKILTFLGLATIAIAYPQADLVTSLDEQPDISFGYYSGYVPVTGTSKSLHYVATLSQNDPTTDPIIIWFNGGPGCSSLIGLMQEIGPYVYNDGEYNLTRNDWAWNMFANVIFLENPAGVGFSLCLDQTECNFDDNLSGDDNLNVVLQLLQKFPEINTNDLYFAGESYAGIYIPYLAYRVDQYLTDNAQNPDVYKPNLKGFAVGNGVTNWLYDAQPATMETVYWFGIVSDSFYKGQKKDCDYSFYDFDYDLLSDECANYMDVLDGWTENLNIYDLLGKCWRDPQPTLSLYETDEQQQQPKKVSLFPMERYTRFAKLSRSKKTVLKSTNTGCGFEAPA